MQVDYDIISEFKIKNNIYKFIYKKYYLLIFDLL